MFMKLIPQIGDLQIHEYNQNLLSNQENESLTFLDDNSNGVVFATNTSGKKWEIKNESGEVSASYGHTQANTSSSQRHLLPLNEGCRSNKRYLDLSQANANCYVASMNATSAISAISENQENIPDLNAPLTDLEPSAKRIRTEYFLGVSTPDKLQDVNFELLNDDTSSPLKHLPMSDFFVVETPSKTLNTSDQQSFHLSSPIPDFASLGIPNAAGKRRVTEQSFRPRALFQQNSTGTVSSNFPLSHSSPLASRTAVNTAQASRIRRFNVMPSSSALSRPQHSAGSYPLHRPMHSNSDSIAVSTAKMTVWSRMASNPPPAAPIRPTASSTPSSFGAISQQNLTFQRLQSSNPPPPGIHKLPYPVMKDPEFTIRRIIQLSHSRRWQRIALGEGRGCQIAIQMARQLLGKQ